MVEEVLHIQGFGTLKYKKLSDAELVTAFEEFVAEGQRKPYPRGGGYIRNLLRQEILFRMRKTSR